MKINWSLKAKQPNWEGYISTKDIVEADSLRKSLF